MMNHSPDPTGYRMLIQPYEIDQVSKGGIILVDESKQYADIACIVGKVIKQGPQCYDKQPEPWCKVGDYVIFAKHCGQKVEVKEEDGTMTRYLFINDDDVRATTDHPQSIKMYI